MKQVVDTSQSILLAESVKPDILNAHFSGLNGVSAIDRREAVQDLLQRLGVGDQLDAVGDGALQQPLGVDLVRMVGPHQVHRQVGVHQNHGAR